jgi:pimeloyl-ACP methyl ester carboxylesterase
MNRLLWAIAIIALCGVFWLAQRAASDIPPRIDCGDGRSLRMRVEGKGSPTVVFEIGLGGALEEWAAVQPEIARTTCVVAYDRIGANHDDTQLTGREIAGELQQGLRAAGIQPPYILVGQSFGGVYNRVFASVYPQDVAGMVLVDPSQEDFIEWMETHHPDRQISRKDTVGWAEGAGIWATLEELKIVGPLPDVPTVVITGARPGRDPLRREVLPEWIRSHARWVRTRPQGRHLLVHNSGHGVHVEAPDTVVKVIREMVEQTRQRYCRTSSAGSTAGGAP